MDLETHAADGVLTVTFNRPQQRNAMTWEMYQGLQEACETADGDPDIKVMVLRGAGGKAFVAGTDIAQFADFDGAAGVAYEERISEVLGRLVAVDVPVVAAIDGYCIGGGLGIAACADVRICTPRSSFGVPIARTLGNCLSIRTLHALVRLLGEARVSDMLIRARLLDAAEAHASGFVGEVVDDLAAATDELTARLLSHAPLTMWATKESLRRLAADGRDARGDDIVERVYGSHDFHAAVAAFGRGERAVWEGR